MARLSQRDGRYAAEPTLGPSPHVAGYFPAEVERDRADFGVGTAARPFGPSSYQAPMSYSAAAAGGYGGSSGSGSAWPVGGGGLLFGGSGFNNPRPTSRFGAGGSGDPPGGGDDDDSGPSGPRWPPGGGGPPGGGPPPGGPPPGGYGGGPPPGGSPPGLVGSEARRRVAHHLAGSEAVRRPEALRAPVRALPRSALQGIRCSSS